MHVTRLSNNPIISPALDTSIGSNINGPSLIRVPDWIDRPLGRYYLYFAHHNGRYIRLAYSDDVTGSWRIHQPGTLHLQDSLFAGHIASPDVHVDYKTRRIRLYYHGADTETGGGGEQSTRVALSEDGLAFTAEEEILGLPYMRVFTWRECTYALAMPGVLYRSADGLSGFAKGHTLFGGKMRHNALLINGKTLTVFYTNIGDSPESIMVSNVDIDQDWANWRASAPATLLKPELDYEGGRLPRVASEVGMVNSPACQLRDPAIFQDNNKRYLLYTVAGESGIVIAELEG